MEDGERAMLFARGRQSLLQLKIFVPFSDSAEMLCGLGFRQAQVGHEAQRPTRVAYLVTSNGAHMPAAKCFG